MPRGLSATNLTRIAAENLTPVILIYMDFAAGEVRLNTTPYPLTYDGNVYTGFGDVGTITGIGEGADVQMYGITLTLTGIPDTYLAIALNENYQGRAMEIYHGFFGATHTLDEDPYTLWKGRIDTMTIEVGPVMTVTVKAESVLSAWDKPSPLRFNDSTQQRRYPGDPSLEFVEQITEKEIIWR